MVDTNKNLTSHQENEKDILERLAKLKAGKSPLERSMEPKMPMLSGEQEMDEYQGIKIPTSDKYREEHSKARANIPVQKAMGGGAVVSFSGGRNKGEAIKLTQKNIEIKSSDVKVTIKPEDKTEAKSGYSTISIPTTPKNDSKEVKSTGVKPRDVHEDEIKVLTTRLFKEENLIDNKKSSLGNYGTSNGTGAVGKIVSAKDKLADAASLKTPEKVAQKEKEKLEKENEGITVSSKLHGSQLTYDKKKIEAARNTLQERGQGWLGRFFGPKESKDSNNQKNATQIVNQKQSQQASTAKNSSGSIHNTESRMIAESFNSGVQKNATHNQINGQKDESIFGGQPEVSRMQLENKMRTDPKIWKAARDSKLNISPVERAKLVKEVFSQTYGRNISKTDLKWGIKKLNQKLVDSKDKPAEHEKIRKEIQFFKKIGGIK